MARLPLLSDLELARLLGSGEPEARALRLALERSGWLERVVVREPGLAQERRSLLRAEALAEFARLPGAGEPPLAARVPARRGDLLARIVRAGAAARVNRLTADLAAALGEEGVALEDARSLPLALRRGERWWPPGVEGYGCLLARSLRAPFFVAWEVEEAPDVHRELRALRWVSPPPAAAGRWGAAGVPPVLLASASAGREGWERAVALAAEKAPGRPLPVFTADADEVTAAGPGAAIWRDPVTGSAGRLVELLGWGPRPPFTGLALGADPGEAGGPPAGGSRGRRTLPRAGDPGAVPGERLAAIAIATDADEKLLLGWIGRWPLLTAPELASLASLPGAAVERRLPRLLALGAARLETAPGTGGAAGPARLLLTPLGLRLLARRAGVPERLYARHAGVVAPARPDSPAVRHRAHQLGLTRAVASLAADARTAGGRLDRCRNEAQSIRRFRHEERGAWIRPDASGVLSLRGGRVPFLFEYDRGTLDSGDFRAKLAGYGRYYAARAWRRDFDAEPALLFLCTDARAEDRVVRAARRARGPASLPLLVASEWRSARGACNPTGLLGPVWRSPAAAGDAAAAIPGPDGEPSAGSRLTPSALPCSASDDSRMAGRARLPEADR